jgi:hypothetical protein
MVQDKKCTTLAKWGPPKRPPRVFFNPVKVAGPTMLLNYISSEHTSRYHHGRKEKYVPCDLNIVSYAAEYICYFLSHPVPTELYNRPLLCPSPLSISVIVASVV